MLTIRNTAILGILFCLFASFATLVFANEANTTWQIITHIDKVLEENPLPVGKKSQLIKIAEDNTISIFVVRMMPGAELGPHYHENHDEIEYVIRGTGQLLVNDRQVDIKPGSIHFNPMHKVHAARNTGNKPLIVLIAFTPAMKVTDRHFLK
ncbi:MAG: cupin domain-containing protein [Deltaproteobacteria bacterium]|nr:cupin domain-containing protein [Deltaproteobacteria bacterium]